MRRRTKELAAELRPVVESAILAGDLLMAYALMQKELVVPELAQLKRAFSVLPTLTDHDAQTVVHDAYGILLRGLEESAATMLCESLLIEGIDTEVVAEAKLPALPPAKIVRQVGFQPGHLTVYDSMKRPSEVPWREVILIAAGRVKVREMHTVKELETLGGTRLKEETVEHLLLELFVTGGTVRFSLAADEFTFDHLGARLTEDRATNFFLLLNELVTHAPHAGLNRGAFLAGQQPSEMFPYPSKQAFHEELTWMLWRIAKLTSNNALDI